MSRPPLSLCSLLVAVLLACSDPPPGPPVLRDIPMPDLDTLDDAVRRQLAEAQLNLFALRDRPNAEPDALGRLYGEQGRLYLAYTFEKAAAACFTNARLLEPEDYRWHYYAGHLARLAGEADSSRTHYGRALELNPSYLPTYESLAELALETNNLDRAETLFSQVHQAAPDRTASRIGLGQIASMRGNHQRAIALLEAIRREGRQASRLNYWLGMSYRATGEIEKARVLLDLEGVPHFHSYDPLIDDLADLTVGALAFNNQGNKAKDEGDLIRARRAYSQAVEADPQVAIFRLNLAVTLMHLEENDGALEQLAAALRLDPNYAAAHYNTGVILSGQGRDVDALLHFRLALKSNPEYKAARFNLAEILLSQDRTQEASEHFSRLLRSDSTHGMSYYGLALAQSRLGRWDAAQRTLEKGHAVLPAHGQLADALARLLAACPVDSLRDGPRALKLTRRLDAEQSTVLSGEAVAMALAEVGRFKEAIRRQEAGLKNLSRARRLDLKSRFEANQALYRAGKPCRQPFPP